MQIRKADDTIKVKDFDTTANSLLIRAVGMDRPGVIAEVTGQLEIHKLYVASITFNLALPKQNQYELEILAKGALPDLNEVNQLIGDKKFSAPKTISEGDCITWPTAYMFHAALNTPDREGLIAEISEIVGEPRKTAARVKSGSFVHMVGITYNSSGTQGGTAYFSMRANIATQATEIQEQIESHLRTWAKNNDIERDLWIRDLNP